MYDWQFLIFNCRDSVHRAQNATLGGASFRSTTKLPSPVMMNIINQSIKSRGERVLESLRKPKPLPAAIEGNAEM
jgi:hypothetical protein